MKIILLLLFFFSFVNNYHVHAIETYVVLKINNKIITNSDINKESRYLVALSPELESLDKKDLMKLAKDSITREIIKENELDKFFDLSIRNKLMDRIVSNYYKRMGMKSRDDFENYLIKKNLKYEEVEYKFTIEAAWNDLIFKKFGSKINIDEEKVKKELEKTISDKKEQNIYSISEILFSAENYNDLDNKYKEINKSILEIGFGKTASIHSISDSYKIGGKIGWINESQLNNIIKKEIINLKIGEHTKPITIPGGFLIVKLNDIKKEKIDIDTNFDLELKKKIFNEQNSQLQQFSELYFKKIYKNSTISE